MFSPSLTPTASPLTELDLEGLEAYTEGMTDTVSQAADAVAHPSSEVPS